MSGDPYRLQRFVDAQDQDGVYARALTELRDGKKTTHWMWFVFPQVVGLGQSQMARTYAIASIGEAMAYLEHPVLGPRLLECAGLLMKHAGKAAWEILGDVDALKLRSSMTLFTRAAPNKAVFQQVLDRYFDGNLDEDTDKRL